MTFDEPTRRRAAGISALTGLAAAVALVPSLVAPIRAAAAPAQAPPPPPAPAATAPPPTAPPTAPATTAPPPTAPPTAPATTAPPSTAAPTTAPPSTAPPTTAPPSTAPATTAPPTAPPTTAPPATTTPPSGAVPPVPPSAAAVAQAAPPPGQPLRGDYDGDGRADILWYGPGGDPDHHWYGRSNRQFGGRPINVSGTYRPIIGDFDGDHRSDILWYAPGAANDVVYYGTASHGFAGKSTTVRGTYLPFTGDFDGDHRSDIFWYAPGSAADSVWYGAAGRTFAGRAVTVTRTLVPLVGDYDGDGRRDIFWYGAGSVADSIWFGAASRTFASKAATIAGAYQPMTGDFDGDHRSDIFWWAPGTGDDLVWFATAGRGFTGRPTTIDLSYERPVPLQPQTMVDAYTPYGYIAHAGGGFDGKTYTNSLDAFEFNYARGFRVFEFDFVVLADGTVLAAHTGLEGHYQLTKPFDQATWAEIAGNKFDEKYTIMRSDEVVKLLREHPDIYVILDTKYQHEHIFRRFVSQTGGAHALMDRVLPHIQDQAELDLYRNTWPLRNYIIALYRTQASGRFDDPEVIDFIRNNRSPGVMMWWKDRDPTLSLSRNHFEDRRFTPTFAAQIRAAGAIAAVHTIRDPADVPRYESLAVAVYSDGPFAVSSQRTATEQPLPVDPVFPPGVTPA